MHSSSTMGVKSRRYEDDDLGGGTKLNFDVVKQTHPEGDAPTPSSSTTSSSSSASQLLGRMRAKFPSATGALVGAALATAVHAAPALAAAAEEGGSLAAVDLALSPIRSLASFVVVGYGSTMKIIGIHMHGDRPDAVDRFLGGIQLGDYATAFRDVGYVREEDFFGITERDLEEEVKVPFAAQRRRIMAHAARQRLAAERESYLWFLLAAGALAGMAALAAFAVALCSSPKLRTFTGSYVGVAGAVAWYWGKKYVEYLEERSCKREQRLLGAAAGAGGAGVVAQARLAGAAGSATPGGSEDGGGVGASGGGGGIGGWMRRGFGGFQGRGGAGWGGGGGASAVASTAGMAGFGTDDDDSAFEGSPTAARSADAAAAAAAAAAIAKRWSEEPHFMEPREQITAWRKSREEYQDYENELLKLKAEVPVSEIDVEMAINGDYDNTYRRFLSANQGKASKAVVMLRKTLEWRHGRDLTGKMKQWRGIDKSIKDTIFEHYQSGWYTSHTSLGCPVYIERTGRFHCAEVLKHVTADDMIDHHTRMMEYLMRVLLPEMGRRPGVPVPDKVLNILDMEGLGLHILSGAAMKILKRVLAIDQSFYPEIMYRCYIVNCPTVFRVVWAAVKPLVDKNIQRKIRIMGKLEGKALDELAAVLGGKDRVPSFLGGGCERTLKQCPPWSLEHMDNYDFKSWEPSVRKSQAENTAAAGRCGSGSGSGGGGAVDADALRTPQHPLTV